MKARLLAFALALVCLTGCASLLDREYNTVEPHSSKFWESEAADTLRAENYQDLVNDLLIKIRLNVGKQLLRVIIGKLREGLHERIVGLDKVCELHPDGDGQSVQLSIVLTRHRSRS